MSEYDIGRIVSVAGVGLLIASVLYWLGGRKNKLWRRLGSAFVLALTVNLSSLVMGNWDAWLLVIFPLLFGGFSLGYGADTKWLKILRRSLYALAVCSGGLVFVYLWGVWWIFLLHLGVGAGSVYLGARNPFHAVAEEFFICMLLNLILIAYPFMA